MDKASSKKLGKVDKVVEELKRQNRVRTLFLSTKYKKIQTRGD